MEFFLRIQDSGFRPATRDTKTVKATRKPRKRPKSLSLEGVSQEWGEKMCPQQPLIMVWMSQIQNKWVVKDRLDQSPATIPPSPPQSPPNISFKTPHQCRDLHIYTGASTAFRLSGVRTPGLGSSSSLANVLCDTILRPQMTRSALRVRRGHGSSWRCHHRCWVRGSPSVGLQRKKYHSPLMLDPPCVWTNVREERGIQSL